jgi:hypothetical protein
MSRLNFRRPRTLRTSPNKARATAPTFTEPCGRAALSAERLLHFTVGAMEGV